VGVAPREGLHGLVELEEEEDVIAGLLFSILPSITSTRWKYSARPIISYDSIKYTAAKVDTEDSADRGGS